eukprot:gene17337-7213_t
MKCMLHWFPDVMAAYCGGQAYDEDRSPSAQSCDGGSTAERGDREHG